MVVAYHLFCTLLDMYQFMQDYVSALASFLAAGAEEQANTGGEAFAQLEAYVLKCVSPSESHPLLIPLFLS